MNIKQLLEARDSYLQAQLNARMEQQIYEAAESAYLNIENNQGPRLDGNTIIIPRDDWYDLPTGSRLDFHKLLP